MKYIGIIGRINDGYKFNEEVIRVIYRYNCVPIGIIVDFKDEPHKIFNQIKPLLDSCDGFILQGGSEYYDIDMLIVRYLYEKNIPVLGICLGMQTIAMTFNGQIGGIASHLSQEKYVHEVDIDTSSYLYQIIGQKKILVNSRHKDSIISTDLTVSGRNEDVIEAIEDNTKSFFIGVQWHPESILDENSLRLFTTFFRMVNKE